MAWDGPILRASPPLSSSLMRLSSFALAALVLLSACDAAEDPPASDLVEITVLVAYTDSARAATPDIEATIRAGFDTTNAVYARSRIDLRLVPVHFEEVDYASSDRLGALADLIGTDDGALDELHTLRDTHEADVVLLVPGRPGLTINGSVMATPETAFLIVKWDVLAYGLAHELGHLQGARHAFEDEPTLEPFPYGHGFRNERFHTIMTGGSPELVPVFSGPDQVHDGVVLGDSTYRDVARVIRESAVYLSNFRGPRTPTDFVPPGTWPTLP